MHYFFLNWKFAAALGASPQTPVGPKVLTPITSYSYFLEGVCQKELRNSNNVLLLPLISYFKLCAGYPSKRQLFFLEKL